MENSPFGKLPAEVRNQIYDLVLICDHPIEVTIKNSHHRKHADDNPKQFDDERKPAGYPTGIRTTCKQILLESAKMFYAANTFVMACTDVTMLAKDLDRIHDALKVLDVTSLNPIIIDLGNKSRHSGQDWTVPHASDLEFSVFEAVETLSSLSHTCKYSIRLSLDRTMMIRPPGAPPPYDFFAARWGAVGFASPLYRLGTVSASDTLINSQSRPRFITLEVPIKNAYSTIMSLSKVASCRASEEAARGSRPGEVLEYLEKVFRFHAYTAALNILPRNPANAEDKERHMDCLRDKMAAGITQWAQDHHIASWARPF